MTGESDDDDNRHDNIHTSDEGDSPLNDDDTERHHSNSTTVLPIHQTNIPRVCCAILASITTGGTTYAFGLYGDALKKSLHLTQSQLDTISAVFFSAGLLSFIPGGFADKYGTRLGISIGGVTGALSLLSFWVVSKGWIPMLSNDATMVVTVLSALSVGIFLSCALVTGSVFKIISCQCGAGSKGSAVGVAKGFVGLGVGCE
jgi:Nodulin-like